jgi:hypothetical protein
VPTLGLLRILGGPSLRGLQGWGCLSLASSLPSSVRSVSPWWPGAPDVTEGLRFSLDEPRRSAPDTYMVRTARKRVLPSTTR